MVDITYNGYSIPNIFGKFGYSENEKQISISCDFLVQSSTEGGLRSACQTAEEKLSEINKDYTLQFGSSNELVFSHSVSSGFLARPQLNKIAGPLSTGTSRHYHFTCDIGLPFLQSPYAYRREGNFVVSYSPARQRTISFTCLYTAGDSKSALVNYSAVSGGKAWAISVLAALGGTYELVDEKFQEEMEEKILNATLVYREIIAKQTSANTNDVNIVGLTTNYSVDIPQTIGNQLSAAYTFIPKPFIRMSLAWSMHVDKSLVALDTDVQKEYIDKIRPWLLSHAFDLLLTTYQTASAQHYIIEIEHFALDNHAYTMNGKLGLYVPSNSDQVYEYTETLTWNEESGMTAEKIWDGMDHSYAMWGVGRKRMLNRTLALTKLNYIPPDPAEYVDPLGQGSYFLMRSVKKLSSQSLGVNTVGVVNAHQYVAYTKTFIEDYLFVMKKEIQVRIND